MGEEDTNTVRELLSDVRARVERRTFAQDVSDPLTGQIDRRWYRRHNPGGQAGWTPSAWVNGNAPDSTA